MIHCAFLKEPPYFLLFYRIKIAALTKTTLAFTLHLPQDMASVRAALFDLSRLRDLKALRGRFIGF